MKKLASALSAALLITGLSLGVYPAAGLRFGDPQTLACSVSPTVAPVGTEIVFTVTITGPDFTVKAAAAAAGPAPLLTQEFADTKAVHIRTPMTGVPETVEIVWDTGKTETQAGGYFTVAGFVTIGQSYVDINPDNNACDPGTVTLT